jgi:hypothetical protein
MENRTCVRCNAPFSPKGWKQQRCQPCSAQYRAGRKNTAVGVVLTCRHCGVQFNGRRGNVAQPDYCPDHRAAWKRAPDRVVTERECRQCAHCKGWTIKPTFCSERCYYRARGVTPPGELKHTLCSGGCGATTQRRKQGTWACERCRTAARRTQKRMQKSKRRAARRGAVSERFDPHYIYKRDGWTCHLCGKRVLKDKVVPHPKAPTIDHVVPLSMGGAHTKQNVRCAHFICNSLKGNGTITNGEQLMMMG